MKKFIIKTLIIVFLFNTNFDVCDNDLLAKRTRKIKKKSKSKIRKRVRKRARKKRVSRTTSNLSRPSFTARNNRIKTIKRITKTKKYRTANIKSQAKYSGGGGHVSNHYKFMGKSFTLGTYDCFVLTAAYVVLYMVNDWDNFARIIEKNINDNQLNEINNSPYQPALDRANLQNDIEDAFKQAASKVTNPSFEASNGPQNKNAWRKILAILRHFTNESEMIGSNLNQGINGDWQGDASEIISRLASLIGTDNNNYITELKFNPINYNTLESLDRLVLLKNFLKENSIIDFLKKNHPTLNIELTKTIGEAKEADNSPSGSGELTDNINAILRLTDQGEWNNKTGKFQDDFLAKNPEYQLINDLVSKANNKDQTENNLDKIMITTWNQKNDGNREMEKISDFEQYIKILKEQGYNNIHIGTHSIGIVGADGSSGGHWANIHHHNQTEHKFDLHSGSNINNHNHIGFLVATR